MLRNPFTFLAPLLVLVGPSAADTPDRDSPRRAGLVAVYRSLDPKHVGAELLRFDTKPAFTWGLSSPHPRLPAGPFEVIWDGVLDLREDHPVRFGAFVSGEVDVTLDGVTVLSGRGLTLTTWIDASTPFRRPPGLYSLRIRYRSLSGVRARVQLHWEGKSFAREPLPASRLIHEPAKLPATLRREELAARGAEIAGRLGCARCHAAAFPGASSGPPGPSLAGVGDRVSRAWLAEWLADPAKVREGAHMPALFPEGRAGLVERALLAEYLVKSTASAKRPVDRGGDHRAGKQAFLGLGCVACHLDPEAPVGRDDPERHDLSRLADRWGAASLAGFLRNPASRYPDGRMPKLPLTEAAARDISAYLLMVSKRSSTPLEPKPVTSEEAEQLQRKLGVADRHATGAALFKDRGCIRCHMGIGEPGSASIPLRAESLAGCLSGKGTPRFALDDEKRAALVAHLKQAAADSHSSPFAARQRLLHQLRCHRCHQRDGDESAPLELIGRTLWTPHLYRMPFQRTPRLAQATARLRRDYLLAAIRDGVTGVRPDWYSYRMPSYGDHAAEAVRALAEGDGDLPDAKDEPIATASDPTLVALGPTLTGFEGYSCVSCHVWAGKSLAAVEPGTVGPEMQSLTRRVRRDWFDGLLDDPARLHPGTPMPAIFRRGEPAPLASVLGGDAAKQKDAIWAYLAQGTKAPSPKPRAPLPVPVGRGPALVSQIPVQIPDMRVIESLCIVNGDHDAIVYDLGRSAVENVYTGAQLLRQSNVWRSYQLAGIGVLPPADADSITLVGPRRREPATATELLGYDRLADGARVRWRWTFRSARIDAVDSLRIPEGGRRFVREIRFTGVPAGHSVEVLTRGKPLDASGAVAFDLPPARLPAATKEPALTVKPDEGHVGPLERPGYRAILYPRPKTATGEDLVMPSALVAHPRDGRLFVASMKLGDLFVVDDPGDDGKSARFERHAHGLFQDAFGLAHDGEDLYALHRRNLSRVRGRDRVDRVAALEHAVGNAYDWGYGLVRERGGSFLFTFAPHASQRVAGSGSLLRLPAKGGKPEEVAFGFRNPLGWCAGPDGEAFFTDNQGDWVATNKLCHVVPGSYYGYPNTAQPQHTRRPMAPTAVWVPYEWAKSINGVAYDGSGGKFGPFAGQFFLAELMHGGAIVRANVEKVNGVYQGACFPFWGKGLLGPLVLTFDPKGRLYVGSVTTPGWMGQPDRGALFRLEHTGKTPFEIQSIHVRPNGFRLVFTRPVDAATARRIASYQVEHYRYEYTGAYGSPELDRTSVGLRDAVLHDDRTLDLATAPLVKGRVYRITAAGVRSDKSEPLVHATGAYTLNEVPAR